MQKASFAYIVLLAFLANTCGPYPLAQAGDEFLLPVPGVMVHLSPPLDPPVLKGIKVHADNPFRFDFILDQGDGVIARSEAQRQSHQEQLKQESAKLIKYFLASLTIPENDLWVNLSPYEKNKIIPQSFGMTEMGRDLLAEDYLLKQITASLIYPGDEIGKKFWTRVYAEAAKRYGTTNVPVNTFNKVWIMPERAVVYENAKAGTAYIIESRLKVMLEEDYLALGKNQTLTRGHVPIRTTRNVSPSTLPNEIGLKGQAPQGNNSTHTFASQIVREIVIPELTKEVNEGKNFARLRQVYNSLILAKWYKMKTKGSILDQVYADKNKVAGVKYTSTVIPAKAGIQFKDDVEGLYKEYLKAFKKGVYNFIKEEQDPVTQEVIPRKYFSGGVILEFGKGKTSLAMTAPADFQVTSDGAMVSRFQNFLRESLMVVATTLTLTIGSNAIAQSAPSQYSDYWNALAAQKKFHRRLFPRGLFPSDDGSIDKPFSADTTAMAFMVLNEVLNDPKSLEARRILDTYLRGYGGIASRNNPATRNFKYKPKGGYYKNIRVDNFKEPDWSKKWPFGVFSEDNAWLGIAALWAYSETGEEGFLHLALRQANFLLALEDTQYGGIREGPKGQYFSVTDVKSAHFWYTKRTVSNQVAFALFQNIAEVLSQKYKDTHDEKYNDPKFQNAADRIYNWLINFMYYPNQNYFAIWATYNGQTWDKNGLFTPETVIRAPLEKMLNDVNLGRTENERLMRVVLLENHAEQTTGIYDKNNNLIGVMFSNDITAAHIISIVFSSGMDRVISTISKKYEELGNQEMADEYRRKSENLTASLAGDFTSKEGYLVAPEAVDVNGQPAPHLSKGTGLGDTDDGYDAKFALSGLDFELEALKRLDPLSLSADQASPAMLSQDRQRRHNLNDNLAKAVDGRGRPIDKLGGIDFNPGKINLQLQDSGGAIKFHIDPSMLRQLQNAPGFTPVIINVQPLADLQQFLGIQDLSK